jgi:hypothetical protein
VSNTHHLANNPSVYSTRLHLEFDFLGGIVEDTIVEGVEESSQRRSSEPTETVFEVLGGSTENLTT